MFVFSPEIAHSTPADMAACRSLLRDGSRSFWAAAHLLPGRVRDPAIALYAFCRVADDAIDLGGAPGEALLALGGRLDRIYDGRPAPQAADRALSDVVIRFRLPRALLDGLLEGFAWDAAGRQYETFADLCDYAARVAGTVGAMMALLMGQRAPAVVGRACDLGIAMQLTNVARDVGEDARAGRLYLPHSWLREAGLDPAKLLERPAHTPALGRVVGRLLAEAERYYARAERGIAALPADCRSGIWAARLFYADIGHAVARRNFDSITARARVNGWRKAALLAQGVTAGLRGSPAAADPLVPCVATHHLVEAVARGGSVSYPGMDAASASVAQQRRGRLIWLLDLFERLERADRLHSASRQST